MAMRRGGFPVLIIVGMTFLAPIFGQVDGGTLRAMYGPPKEEVFEVRPGITMAVIYGDNHQVCKLEVRPARNESSVIPATVIQQVVDEVVPPSIRGKSKGEFLRCAAFCWRLAVYEDMSVGQAAGDVTPNPEAPTQNSLAVIQFKTCQAPKR